MPRLWLTSFVWLAMPLAAVWAQGAAEEPIAIEGGGCRVEIDTVHGTLIAAGQAGGVPPVLRGGESGLWRMVFEDGSALDASQFQAGKHERRLTVRREAVENRIELTFEAPEAAVQVRVQGGKTGVDLSATVRPRKKAVLAMELPARMRFDPKGLVRLTSPLEPHEGVGAAFRKGFFEEQTQEFPTSWRTENLGPAAFDRLVGANVVMRPLDAAPEPITVTAEGKRRLGENLSRELAGARVDACRPLPREKADLILLDSPAGPVLTASRLGGRGALWRWSGFIRPAEARTAADALAGVVHQLASEPATRRKVGLVHVSNGPETASGTSISVNSWAPRLAKTLQGTGKEFVELTTPKAMLAAVQGNEFLAILNPYGESLPADDVGVAATVDLVGQYIRRGGNWIETGGYPFYQALRPVKFLEHRAEYPPLFADWVHVETSSGALAVYRVQPRDWSPWEGTRHPSAIFIPGRAAFGGDAQGGWIERSFATHVAPRDRVEDTRRKTGGGPIGRPFSRRLCRGQRLDETAKRQASARPVRPLPPGSAREVRRKCSRDDCWPSQASRPQPDPHLRLP